ncbi:PaaX family transcriptional regulator C-terminal domain-containing protein [Cellulomonas bogoriensis]|uniref:PaaX family transcriptional regulator n=1 Tax=Cellulomonas bogoriensis 69B4 = DSM 16987 TaxID=1386082 RepID=A0A0A0BPV4_9CELL|nr:PaaX family transcriptional regulator C-terminal domain-containing protein [Cellulomonas bogoriensis]KGM09109.1 PaaX family transcriptional regulator [Cellulomonas bogoriensis 69B4 = DSM 16987]
MDPADVRLPRARQGNAPQATTVMLLAEFGIHPRPWFGAGPLATLVTDIGTTPAGARAVLQRLVRRGVLERRQDGRHAFYRLTGPTATALAHGGRALATFTARAEQWGGTWTVIAFSSPQHADTRRATLRARLRWRGFAPLYDGVWCSPDDPHELGSLLEPGTDLTFTVLRAQHLPLDLPGAKGPLDVWDLDATRTAYQDFLTRWEAIAPQVAGGRLRGADAVRARTQVTDDYRRFAALDPRLPAATMPPGWPRARAWELFCQVYDALAEPALAHVLDVTGMGEDEVRAHTVADLASGRLLDALRGAL